MGDLPPNNDLERRDREQDIKLKRKYADWLLLAMGGQIAIANLAFLIYGFWLGWDIPASVMGIWLSATVVEVIGVVLVVTRYLFPNRSA